MPPAQTGESITEFQTLYLLPDSKIGNLSSGVLKTLESGLRATASHPDCLGVWWMKETGNAQKIVVISKWTHLDPATLRSHSYHLLPHLQAPPTPSIYVDYSSFSFSSLGTSKFLTLYFLSSKCTPEFHEQLNARIQMFVNHTFPNYGFPQNLAFITSAWIKKTRIIDRQETRGLFLYCISRRHYQAGNPHWESLIEDIRAMGVLREEESHGKLQQVRNESSRKKYEFPDDTSDDDNDLNEYLGSHLEKLEKLRKMSWNQIQEECVDRVITCRGMGEPISPMPDAQRARIRERLDRLDRPPALDFSSENKSMITSTLMQEPESSEMGDSDVESPTSSPLLTPSSSMMSLDTFCDDSKPMSELPGTWKSEFDISRSRDVEDDAQNPFADPAPNHRTSRFLDCAKYQFEVSSDSEDEESDLGLVTKNDLGEMLRRRSVATYTEPTQEVSSLSEKVGDTPISCRDGKAIPRLMRQAGASKWNPEEELQKAKSRFSRHGKRLPALRLEGQRAEFRSESPEVLQATLPQTPDPVLVNESSATSNYESNDSSEGEKVSWWAYFRDSYLKPCAGVSKSDRELVEGIFSEKNASNEKVGRKPQMRIDPYPWRQNVRDPPLSANR